MGLWMIQSIRRELNGVSYIQGKSDEDSANRQLMSMTLKDTEFKLWSFPDLSEMAKEAENFKSIVDVNRDCFLAPDSMIRAIREECRRTGQSIPETVGELMQCMYRSLAICYRDAIHNLEKLTGKHYTGINIVGGGCRDTYLNECTAKTTGLTVYAGPVEGTAIGNLLVQMITGGEIEDLAAARGMVRESFRIEEVRP